MVQTYSNDVIDAHTCSSKDDTGNVRGRSITFRRFGLHPEVITPIALKAAQLQVIGSGQHGTFSNINLSSEKRLIQSF